MIKVEEDLFENIFKRNKIYMYKRFVQSINADIEPYIKYGIGIISVGLFGYFARYFIIEELYFIN